MIGPSRRSEEERQSAMTIYLVIAVVVLTALVLFVLAIRYL